MLSTFLTKPNHMNSKQLKPFEELGKELFDNIFAGAFGLPFDVVESETHYIVELSIPGYRKDQITIDAINGTLLVSGENKRRSTSNGETFLMEGIHYGKFSKRFSLPDNADAEKIAAKLEDGILRITVPKTDKKSKIKID